MADATTRALAYSVAYEEKPWRPRLRWWQATLVVAIGLAIAAVEWIFTYRDVGLAIGLALALALLVYLAMASLRLGQRIANCAESLALIPLYILFTSSLPWFFLGQEFLLPAVYAVVLILCFWHIYQRGLSLREMIRFELKDLPKYLAIGILLGIPAGATEYLVLTPAATSPAFQVANLLRDMAYMLAFVGLAEELLFRGLIQRDLVAAFGARWGIFGASALFAVMHLTWRSIPELAFVFCVGAVLGYAYYSTKSLVAPVIAHGVGNTVLVAVMPYLIKVVLAYVR